MQRLSVAARQNKQSFEAVQVENTCLGQKALLSVGERPARLHEANLRVVHQVRQRAQLQARPQESVMPACEVPARS